MTLQQWKEAFAQEKEKLSTMSWPQKIGYIFAYYKFQIIIFLVVAAIAIALPVNYFVNNKEELVTAIMINTTTSKEGYDVLTDDFLEHMNGNPKEEMVRLHRSPQVNYENPNIDQLNSSEVMKIIAMMSSGAIDVIISDATAVDAYGPEDGLHDLSHFLPGDLYEDLKPLMVSSTSIASGKTFPVAIDISDTAFASQYDLSADPCYISFPCTGEQDTNAIAFLEYLLSIQ